MSALLGGAFFSDPLGDYLKLTFDLRTMTMAPDWIWDPGNGPGGYPATVSAHFYNTLRLIGLEAYDAAGNDVTDQAVMGFVSMDASQPPDPGTVVPEPASLSLLALGLFAVSVVARRRAPSTRD